jgi:hypothetical protein
MNLLRRHSKTIKGFVLPALLIIVPLVLAALFMARNSEACKKAKARGEKCPSIWWGSDERKDK